MKTKEQGQIILLVAFFMILMIFFVIVISDLFQVYLRKQELRRLADCAGKSGMILVGDSMMTQAAEANTGLEDSDAIDWTTICGSSEPWETLTAPPLKTAITGAVEDTLVGLAPDLQLAVDVDYPYRPSSPGGDLSLYVSLCQHVELTFGALVGNQQLVIYGDSEQIISCP